MLYRRTRQLIPVALATEALPGSVETRAPTLALAVSGVRYTTTAMGSRDSSTFLDDWQFIFSAASLDEFVNGPSYSSGAHVEDVDVEASRNPKR